MESEEREERREEKRREESYRMALTVTPTVLSFIAGITRGAQMVALGEIETLANLNGT